MEVENLNRLCELRIEWMHAEFTKIQRAQREKENKNTVKQTWEKKKKQWKQRKRKANIRISHSQI